MKGRHMQDRHMQGRVFELISSFVTVCGPKQATLNVPAGTQACTKGHKARARDASSNGQRI